MKYSERRFEFRYQPELFKLKDTVTALHIYHESVKKHSTRPGPRFFEIDRSTQHIDPLWGTPTGTQTPILRAIDLPCITKFLKNAWTLTKLGMVPQKQASFLVSHLSLIEFDYFPARGDLISWNGYTYMITLPNIPGEAYWGQTNVWLGIDVQATIPPEGDNINRIPELWLTKDPQETINKIDFQSAILRNDETIQPSSPAIMP